MPRPFPKTIGPQFVKRIMPWVEDFWHSHKRYPTDLELSAKFGFDEQQLLQLRHSKFYNNALKNRGISQNSTEFTSKQIAAMTLITNFMDPRPPQAKLASIGVTVEQYNGWKSDTKFMEALRARADDLLGNVYPEAQAQLAKKVASGDFQSLKFYYEITGRAQSPESINLKMAVVKIVEAIQKHVKDPAILQAIANDVQGNSLISPVAAPQAQELTMKEQYEEFVKNGN